MGGFLPAPDGSSMLQQPFSKRPISKIRILAATKAVSRNTAFHVPYDTSQKPSGFKLSQGSQGSPSPSNKDFTTADSDGPWSFAHLMAMIC